MEIIKLSKDAEYVWERVQYAVESKGIKKSSPPEKKYPFVKDVCKYWAIERSYMRELIDNGLLTYTDADGYRITDKGLGFLELPD